MKRQKLIKKLIANGCYLKRHGGSHDLYVNPRKGRITPVPRHKEIKESLCKLIMQQLDIE
jgi:predicted RNA binding protein YcfA (HicA-like mRNA interferase family)